MVVTRAVLDSMSVEDLQECLSSAARCRIGVEADLLTDEQNEALAPDQKAELVGAGREMLRGWDSHIAALADALQRKLH